MRQENSKLPSRRVLLLLLFLHKIVYLVYRSFNVYFSQGGQVYPVPPYVFSAPLFFRLPALSLVVVGGGQVYAGGWGVGGIGCYK